jgi:hypothetical protein
VTGPIGPSSALSANNTTAFAKIADGTTISITTPGFALEINANYAVSWSVSATISADTGELVASVAPSSNATGLGLLVSSNVFINRNAAGTIMSGGVAADRFRTNGTNSNVTFTFTASCNNASRLSDGWFVVHVTKL